MSKFVRDNMTSILTGIVGTLVMALALGGWAAREYVSGFATTDDVRLAWAKADYVLDRQIETLVAQIAHLERKGNLTASERQQLDYLRQQLISLRKVRGGQ